MRSWKIALAVFCLDWLLMSGSYTLMFPFLPVYLKNDLGCPEESLTFWSSACFGIQFVFSALLSPFWGRVADRFGRKLMLLRASSMLALSYFICMLVTTPLQLFCARIFMGFACGITPVILSMTSDTVPKNRLGFSMGLLQSMNVLGSVVGPLAGGFIAQSLSVRYTFLITTCALSAVTLMSLIFIREPQRAAGAAPRAKAPSVVSVLRRKEILSVLMIGALAFFILLLPVAILTPYVTKISGDGSQGVVLSGLVFSLSGIAGAVASPLWGIFGQRRGFFKALVISMALASLMCMLQSVPQSIWPFALLQFGVGLMVAGISPSVNALMVQVTPRQARTTAFGLLYSFTEAGSGSGSLCGGFIASVIGTRLIFCAGGMLLLLVMLLVIFKAPLSLRRRSGTSIKLS